MTTIYKETITVLISSSPIPSHPSCQIIQETIDSVRYHLPDSKIIVMLDGVRPEQEESRGRYSGYIVNLVAKVMNGRDREITLWPFVEFIHQAGMTMKALTEVRTPFVLFVEHDTPLVDKRIDWPMLQDVLNTGASNHIRLHYDEQIHPDHKHMTMGYLNPNLIKTIQWHQRPHLSLTAWYKQVLAANFTEASRTWIEDKVYSPVSCSEWKEYRLTIYDPEGTGKNMKRSRDLNGRAGDKKYDPLF